MLRLFFFLLLVLGLGFLFSWIADNPGTIFLSWDWLSVYMTGEPGNEVGIPLTLAISGLVFLIAAIMITTGLLRGIFGMPSFISKFFENRRRDRGYKALSRGLIAASSGDIDMARSASKESGKLLDNEPLVALLATQTALLDGKRDEAKENFSKMLENDDTKLVALRGLFLEAERQGEPTAARHYAEEAVRLAPSLPWAGNAKLTYQAGDADWDAAILTLDANRAAGLIDKVKAKRQYAVLLTAKAYAEEPANPDRARSLAKRAHKAAYDLVPAAIIYARAASRLGDIKSASKIIEETWKTTPHPELAQAYSVVRPGDSVQDRLSRAKKLADMKPKHPESCMALAIAAIDAQDWDQARKALEPILTTGPTERACLLMADIEEGQHGDQGRMRDWLSRAVRALPDPAWVADAHVSEEWLPVSPVTGEIDAFEWKVPVENLTKISAPTMTLEELQEQAKPIEIIKPVVEEKIVEVKEVPEPEKTPVLKSVVAPTAAAIAAKATASEVQEQDEVEAEPEPITEDTETEVEVIAEIEDKTDEETATPVDTAEIIEIAAANNATTSEAAQAQVAADAKVEEELIEPSRPDQPAERDNTVKFPLERRPDDPGVHPDKVKAEKKGFGLF